MRAAMPQPRVLIAVLIALSVVALLVVWAPWAGDSPHAPDPAASQPAGVLQPPSLLAVGAAGPAEPASAPTAVVAAAKPPCPQPEPMAPHQQALALQRAIAALAGAGDETLALLLQKPADPAGLAPWGAQVRAAALRSQDVPSLRWAAGACEWAERPVACRRELIAARLKLEPDNGLHWLEWLDEDPAGAEDGWRGLAAARRWQERPGTLDERLARALPPGLTAGQRESLLGPLREYQTAWLPQPSSTVLLQQCGHWGPGHPTGAACAQALTLLAQADSAQAQRQGQELAQLMGRTDIVFAPLPTAPATPAACEAQQSSR